MIARLLRHLRRLVRHGGWMTLAVLCLYGVRHVVPLEVMRGLTDVAGNVLQTFGGMYGVVVAFAIFVTWQQHNDSQIAVEHEAVSLIELYRALGWFDSWPQRDAVRARLHAYALAVPANNDPNTTGTRVDERALLEGALAAYLRHEPSSPREARLFDMVLELFHELNETRAHRQTVASLRLPGAMRWFVQLGGALCVFTVEMMWVPDFFAHAGLACAMTWVVVAATSTMLDLDDPFTGDFVIEWSRFELAAQAMQALPDAGTAEPT